MKNTEIDTGKLRRLTEADRVSAAGVLSRAFRDYDLIRYYFPDENQRQDVAYNFGFISLSVCLKYGEAYSTANMEGVALWLPPGTAPFGFWQVLHSVPVSALIKFGRQGAARLKSYSRFEDRLHRKLLPGPHWYLQMLGVDPKYQGQGYSRRLVGPMLERTDREKLPCYLETNNLKNVSIYQKFGFKLVSEDKVPGKDLTNFAMLRKKQ